MFTKLWTQLTEFLAHSGAQIIWTIVMLAVIVVGKILIDRFWNHRIREDSIPKHAVNILRVFTTLVAITLAVIVCTTIWQVEGSWLIGGLGLSAGTIIGFASSETIGNAIAGFILLFSRPFRIGNRVRINGYLGDVNQITLIYTTVVTPNLEEINIPNRQVLNAEIVNYGKDKPIRLAIPCTVGYTVDLNYFKRRLLAVAHDVEGVAHLPQPLVRLTDLGNYAAEFTLYIYTYSPVLIPQLESTVREHVWQMYKSEGFQLSTPNLVQSVTLPKSYRREYQELVQDKQTTWEQLARTRIY
jgi:small-conductance mechanosensitive channel